MKEDAKFLTQHNFMDYSLLMFVVIKPFKYVCNQDRNANYESYR